MRELLDRIAGLEDRVATLEKSGAAPPAQPPADPPLALSDELRALMREGESAKDAAKRLTAELRGEYDMLTSKVIAIAAKPAETDRHEQLSRIFDELARIGDTAG